MIPLVKLLLALYCIGMLGFVVWAWYDHYTFWKKMGYYK